MKEEEEGRDGVGGAMAFFFSCPPLFPRPSPAAAGAVMKRPFPTDDRPKERNLLLLLFSLLLLFLTPWRGARIELF